MHNKIKLDSAQTELTAQSQERMRVLVAGLEQSPHDDISWAGMAI
jgi:hypothetical protein